MHKTTGTFFGEIRDGIINLSDVGKLANKFWLEIPDHFSGVFLDAHRVMPIHMHGILVIDKPNGGDAGGGDDTGIVETPKLGVSTDGTTIPINGTDDIPRHLTESASQKWKPQSVGVIINQYKRKCTIDAWKINPVFAWQPSFHDHIIRNDKEFQRIREYIINNPKIWEKDSLR